jgi:hypothetical protein
MRLYISSRPTFCLFYLVAACDACGGESRQHPAGSDDVDASPPQAQTGLIAEYVITILHGA